MNNEIKILIADEDVNGRKALTAELRRMGFNEIIEAENGENALVLVEMRTKSMTISWEKLR